VAFQKQSLARMKEVASEGRTVIFVSHNMAAIRALCKTGVYLERGRAAYAGDIDSTVKTYLDSGDVQSHHKSKIELKPNPSLRVQFLSVAVLDSTGRLVSSISHERPFMIQIGFEVRQREPGCYLALDILDENKEPVLSSLDFERQEGFVNYNQGTHALQVTVPPILVPGEYHLSLRAIRKSWGREILLDAVQEVCTFEISDGGSARSQAGLKWTGRISQRLAWEQKEKAAQPEK
jgi:lipopolysaccharide transport system ATP-binding protein